MIYGIIVGLHTLAAVIWVGGMFFAHMALRPALAEMNPPERLGLWRRVLPRFFVWVWISIPVLLVSGYGTLLAGYKGGLGGGALHVDIMQVTGLLMIALFTYMYFGPFQTFKRSLAAGAILAAATALGRVRHVVTVNLVLGLITIFVGSTGTFVGY